MPNKRRDSQSLWVWIYIFIAAILRRRPDFNCICCCWKLWHCLRRFSSTSLISHINFRVLQFPVRPCRTAKATGIEGIFRPVLSSSAFAFLRKSSNKSRNWKNWEKQDGDGRDFLEPGQLLIYSSSLVRSQRLMCVGG